MRKAFQIFLMILIALAIIAGINSGDWKYPIAFITLSVLGLIASKVRRQSRTISPKNKQTNSSVFVASATTSSSDAGSCGGDGGGC